MVPPWLLTLVGTVVTVIWGATFVADILSPKFEPDPSVHLVMMVVAGGLFAAPMLKRRNGNGVSK